MLSALLEIGNFEFLEKTIDLTLLNNYFLLDDV